MVFRAPKQVVFIGRERSLGTGPGGRAGPGLAKIGMARVLAQAVALWKWRVTEKKLTRERLFSLFFVKRLKSNQK